VPNFRRGAASLAHPDPVGLTAYSKSAIGHLAFYNLTPSRSSSHDRRGVRRCIALAS
jgi:hypothetical protein